MKEEELEVIYKRLFWHKKMQLRVCEQDGKKECPALID